jgi:hypothetical protein
MGERGSRRPDALSHARCWRVDLAVVDAVLLTPPPFTHPDELYTVGEVPTGERATAAPRPRSVTWATFDAWRARARSLAALEAFDGTNLTMTDIGPAERVAVTDSTPGLLTLLGVSPVLGRTFAADDVARPVAILSQAFWRGKFGADPNVIGREIVLGARSHTVIGVLPERFVFALGVADVWRSFAISPAQAARDGVRVLVIARSNGTAPPSQIAAALDDISRASTPPARVVTTGVTTAIAGNRATILVLLPSSSTCVGNLYVEPSASGYLKCQKWPFTSRFSTSRSEIAVWKCGSQFTSRLSR